MTERHLPLYRKYRPQTLNDLIGQENIVKALTNAMNLNKVAHAYLLCGPRGTGKTSTARIIAKSLNCKNGPTLEPCGKCPSCVEIINGTPIDVIEIDAASNRKVEDARNILEKIQFVPVNGHFKIYIIDEVHMLTTEAFNTLLKTLEEPPENVIFILATTEPHKVLETIISRCQRFDFRRVKTDDIVGRLSYIAKEEKINISKEALETIAKSSSGGMRDSVALLDQISVMGTDHEISTDDVNEMLGRLSFETLFDISNAIAESKTEEAILLLDKVYNSGNEPFQIVSNLIKYFRNLLVVKNCTDRSIAQGLTQESEANVVKMHEQVQNLDAQQILYTIERLSFYSKEIKETTNRYLWLELCVIELASNVKFASYTALLERVEKLESQVASGDFCPSVTAIVPPVQTFTPVKKEAAPVPVKPAHAPAPTIEPAAPAKVEPAPISESQPQKTEKPVQPAPTVQAANGDLAQNWQGILQHIESVPSRMFFYNLSRPVSLSNELVVISFAKDIFVKQAKEPTKNEPLKKASMAHFGVSDINIQVRLAEAEEGEPEVKLPPIQERKPTAPPRPVEESAEEENAAFLKETMSETSEKERKEEIIENLSDQSKMVMELFNGKYID